LSVQGTQFWVEGLHDLAVVTELAVGEVAEQFQDPGRRGCGAGAELGVERDVAVPAVAMAVRISRSMSAPVSSAR